MTDGELTAIESWWADQDAISMRPSSAFAHDDVRKLIAEVRRLRRELEYALEDQREALEWASQFATRCPACGRFVRYGRDYCNDECAATAAIREMQRNRIDAGFEREG